MTGQGIVRASWGGTIAFGTGTVAGVVAPDPLAWLGFAVSLALFVAGCVVFVSALPKDGYAALASAVRG